MKQGGNGTLQRGFTMVEVLIVLAVTSSLLVIAMVIINGRLAKTEFAVGSRQIRQEFESVINEAGSGFSANSGNIKCGPPISSPPIPILSSGGVGVDTGQNSDCIFIGKVIVLGTYTLRSDNMRVIPLAGKRQFTPGGSPRPQNVTELKDAWPVALAPSPDNDVIPDLSETIALPQGFKFSGAWVSPDPLNTRYAVAVLSELAGGEAQHFSVYGRADWNPSGTDLAKAEVDEINKSTDASETKYKTYDDAIHLCFAHEGTGQSAEMILGRSGGLGVETEIHKGATCGHL